MSHDNICVCSTAHCLLVKIVHLPIKQTYSFSIWLNSCVRVCHACMWHHVKNVPVCKSAECIGQERGTVLKTTDFTDCTSLSKTYFDETPGLRVVITHDGPINESYQEHFSTFFGLSLWHHGFSTVHHNMLTRESVILFKISTWTIWFHVEAVPHRIFIWAFVWRLMLFHMKTSIFFQEPIGTFSFLSIGAKLARDTQTPSIANNGIPIWPWIVDMEDEICENGEPICLSWCFSLMYV